MKLIDIPSKFTIPFADGADPAYIRAIPVTSQIGITAGAASLEDGFVPLNMTPRGAGGVPPFGSDMNGILNQMSAWDRWTGVGGSVPWDSVLSAAIGGYPKGAIVKSVTTANLFWLSTADDNVTNPDTGGTGWLAWAPGGNLLFYGVDTSVTPNTITVPTTIPFTFDNFTVGMCVEVKINRSNTGPTVINLWATFNQNVHTIFDTALVGGELIAGMIATFIWNGTSWCLAAAALSSMGFSTGFQAYTSHASGNFTVPAGVSKIFAELWGAGGGGGGCGGAGAAAAGGGGGGYCAGFFTVAPAATLAYVIGTGGSAGGGSGGGNSGGNSTFQGMTAGGGAGGPGAIVGADAFAALGGTAAGPGGCLLIPGGRSMGGQLGGTSLTGNYFRTYGGAGGSAARGGPGGRGYVGDGEAGVAPGGGGGGGGSQQFTGGYGNGAAGADGWLVIRW